MCWNFEKEKKSYRDDHKGERKWTAKMKDRKCTDVYCTILFGIFWLVMGAIMLLALWIGDWSLSRIIYGMDYQGHTCGVDHTFVDGGPDLTNKKRIVYPRVLQDLLIHAVDFATDVEQINDIIEDPTLVADFALDFHPFGVCVEECPKQGDWVCTYDFEDTTSAQAIQNCYDMDFFTLLIDNAASAFGMGYNCQDIIANCFPTAVDNKDYFFRCLPLYDNTLTNTEECIEWYTTNNSDTTVFNNLNCLTAKLISIKETVKPAKDDILWDVVNEQVAMVNNIFDDFWKSKHVILSIGFGGGLLLSFLWLVVLRCCTPCIVWGTIVVVYVLTLLVVLLCYIKGGIISLDNVVSVAEVTDDVREFVEGFLTADPVSDVLVVNGTLPFEFLFSTQYQNEWKIGSYIATGLWVVFLVVGFVMYSRILLAIKIIQEATNAIKDMPSVMLWPLYPSVWILVFLAYFLYSACFIATMGEVTPQQLTEEALFQINNLTGTDLVWSNSTITDTKYYTSMDAQPILQVFNLFTILWTMALINAISFTTMAGAFCRWYWSHGDSKMKENFPLCRSYGRVMQYHFGTMAFGSFILALVRLVRLVLLYLDKKTREAQKNNKVVKTLFKVVHCLLWCFERCLKFLARQAYIMVAMYGYSFCKASMTAIMLITSNVLRIATVNVVNRYVMLLGKLVVCVSCMISSYAWLSYSPEFHDPVGNPDNLLYSEIPATIVITLFSYIVSTYIFNVYHVGVDTILLCFCQDCLIHDTEDAGGSVQDTKLYNKGMQKKIKQITRKTYVVREKKLTPGTVAESKRGDTSAVDEREVELLESAKY